MIATESDAKSDEGKTSILLSSIGSKGTEIFGTLQFSEVEDNLNLELVRAKSMAYCNPRKSTTTLRHKFFLCKQQDGQVFNDYVAKPNRQSPECECFKTP